MTILAIPVKSQCLQGLWLVLIRNAAVMNSADASPVCVLL